MDGGGQRLLAMKEDRMHETTSFGLYDAERYPEPAKLISYFHSRGLKFLQGLRTTFITDGPYSEEGARDAFFIRENDSAKAFRFGWPKSPTYLLDWRKPEAVAWYTSLAHKWTGFGVDGFKEDVYGFGKYELGDDKLDPVNIALMREGWYVMGRNAYLASPADLHRINDFNYNQNQDRGPVNALAAAYAGFPLVYPDIVGGTFGEGHFDLKVTQRMQTYMMRNAQWASLHSSIGMGQGPWIFGSKQVESVMLNAAKLHDKLQPYIFSQAIRFYRDGYPWTMTPLPIAFPDEAGVYGRENDRVRGYEWMIGNALLATPLYGNDFETASTRDIYLPRGTWFEYDSGARHEGPAVLKSYALPPGKTPLFVGGSGVVLEKRGSSTVARVYPLQQQATEVFYGADGETKTTIRMDVRDWKSAAPHKRSSGAVVRVTRNGPAFEFPVVAGEEYELR